jgi:hypothetical protein
MEEGSSTGSVGGGGITAYNLQRAEALLLEHLRRTPPLHQRDTADIWAREYERLRHTYIFTALRAGKSREQALAEVASLRAQALREDDSKKRELKRSMNGRLIEWNANEGD